MAGAEHQMEPEPLDESEMEMHDIHYWMDQLGSHIQENQERNVRLNHALQQIRDAVTSQERLNQSTEAQEEDVEEIDQERMTECARSFIDNTEGVLHPDQFYEFLMEKSYRKPNLPVQPILRKYTHEVDRVKIQLKTLKANIRRRHQEYMIERKKDVNLERRIERLLENITKEQNVEEKCGLQQSSILSYMDRR